MRKIFSFLAAILFAGSMMATDPVYSYVPVKASSNSTYNTYYSSTSNGLEWMIMANLATDNQTRFGGKSITNEDRPMYTKAALGYAIDSIIIKHGGISSDKLVVNSIKVEVASDAAFETILETKTLTPTVAKNTAGTVKVELSKAAKDSYYRITFNITNPNGTNYAFMLTGIDFYEKASTPEPPVSSTVNLYLKAGDVDYTVDNAVVAAWVWKTGKEGAWYTFAEAETSGVSYITIPDTCNNMKIMRWAAGTTPSWDVENDAYNKTGDIAFPATYPATTDMIELNDWNGATTGTWTKYVPEETKYYVKGSFDEWQAGHELVAGTYTFEDLDAGTYEIKVTDGKTKWYGISALDTEHSSANIFGTDNIEFTLAAAGNVTVAFNTETKKITVTGTFVAPSVKFTVNVPEGTEKVYIGGNFNNWTPAEMALKAGEEDIFELTVSGIKSDTVKYKYLAGADWKYVEVREGEGDASNRTYAAEDFVTAWTAVPTIYKYAKVKAAPVNWTGHYILAWEDLKPHSAISGNDFVAAEGAPTFVDGDTISVLEGNDYAVEIRFNETAGAYEIKLPNGKYIKIPGSNAVNEDETAVPLYLAYYKGTNQEGVQIGNAADLTSTSTRMIYKNNTNYRSYTNKINSASYKLPVLYRLVDEPYDCQDGPFAVLINGTDVVNVEALTGEEEYDASGRKQYRAYLSLTKNDSIQIINTSCGVTFLPEIEEAGAQEHFHVGVKAAKIDSTGCFDLYLKLKNEDDKLYIGYGICPGDTVYPSYYLVGTMTDWVEHPVELTTVKDDTLSATINLKADSLYAYKVIRIAGTDTTWYGLGGEAVMTYGNSTGWFIYKSEGEDNQANVGLLSTKEGAYPVTLVVKEDHLEVSIEIAARYYAKYNNGEEWAWKLMNEKEGKWLTDTVVYYGGGMNVYFDKNDADAWYFNESGEEAFKKIAAYEGFAALDTVQFSFNPADTTLAVALVHKYVAPAVHYYIAGTMTDWTTNMVELLPLDEKADSLGISLFLKADSLYAFKAVRVQGKDTAWYGLGGEAVMTYGNSTGWFIYKSEGEDNQANVGLLSTKEGAYPVTLVVKEDHLEVSVVIPKPDPKYYVKAQWSEVAEDWSWKLLANNEGKWSTERFVYRGIGVNINDKADDEGKLFYSNTTVEEGVRPIGGDAFAELDTIVLTFNPADSVMTAKVIGKYVSPYVLENGFYLIGQNGWDAAALDASLLFAAFDETQYKLTVTLTAGQEIKVGKVVNDAIVQWYPEGDAPNYTVDANHAGETDIYFSETYNVAWAPFGGYFYVVPTGTVDIQNVATDAKAVKVLKNGQILIMKGDKTYTIFGQIVK